MLNGGHYDAFPNGAATQDSSFDFGNNFTLPSQSSQYVGSYAAEDLLSGRDSEFNFQEDDDWTEQPLPEHACK
jgi:hypothetical protein